MTPLGDERRDFRCSTCSLVAVANADDLGGNVEPKRRKTGLAFRVADEISPVDVRPEEGVTRRKVWADGLALAARLASAMAERRIIEQVENVKYRDRLYAVTEVVI
jgi:hypothetical protein